MVDQNRGSQTVYFRLITLQYISVYMNNKLCIAIIIIIIVLILMYLYSTSVQYPDQLRLFDYEVNLNSDVFEFDTQHQ